jgi:anaerobic selenocysteine-containing dehydrogenase
MMHLVIANAWRGDPYPIDTLFMFMANMAWNSAMNTAGTIEMLTDKNPETGEYKIPRIIYADSYFSEMVAYADLVLPDTTYLERWDCISLLDRPISDADGPADAVRQPVIAPDRDVRPFQDVLIDLAVRLRLPDFTNDDGSARYPGGYPDYIVNHERKPGVGSLAGWRGTDGDKEGRGPANADQLDRYVENQCFWRRELPENQKYYKAVNRDYLAYAAEMGFIDRREPIFIQLYSEVLQKFRLAARGHGPVLPPPKHRARIETYFDPLPIWYPPFEDTASEADDGDFPLHAVTQRPMAMYHSWGGQNAWLRQIHGSNRLYVPRGLAESLGLDDGDWAWVTSRHGRIKVRVRPMAGVNEHTLWTWNAIGKRAGAWNLDPDSPEAKEGFLLNHLIAELLPEREGAYRYASADPVTGQAAWYDLRVRLEKATPAEAGEIEPQFPTLSPPDSLEKPPAVLRYGAAKSGRR